MASDVQAGDRAGARFEVEAKFNGSCFCAFKSL